MNLQWYVLRSKPNKEVVLWQELIARSFDCFFPQLSVRSANPRSRKIRPYFPGYLFVHTDLEQVGFSTFQWMPFSIGLLAFDGVPATVPDNLLQGIRRHVDEINRAGGEQLAGFRRGEKVMIQAGPFKGYEAIFDAGLPGTERVRVFLQLLRSRQVGVELSAGQVRHRTRK